jgi:hypothetical protein
LQAILDSEGDESSLPDEIVALTRRLGAAKSQTAAPIEKAAHNLEKAYVLKEIQEIGRLLQSPEVLADPESSKLLRERMTPLMKRKSFLMRKT